MKKLSLSLALFLALVLALTPLLSCAEETPPILDAEELYQMAIEYYEGDQPDYAKMKECLEQAIAMGHAKAMNELGYHYEVGTFDGVSDYAKALELYLMSAELGNRVAMYNLGAGYHSGRLNEDVPDYAKAKEWYLKAAELGFANAMHYLGHLYQNGYVADGVPDYKEAAAWYWKAWENGNEVTPKHLVKMFRDGVTAEDGTVLLEPDHAQLLPVLEKLYTSGSEDPNMFSWLGWLLAGNSPQNVCEPDYPRAVEVYARGAELGSGYCMMQLGLIYEDGRLGTADLVAAEAWYIKAVEAGESGAQEALDRVRNTP